jgi:effector-binding domain-containing protein
MPYDIAVRRLEPQHTAVIRATCAWSEIPATLGAAFGEIFPCVAQSGAVPGMPFARYTPHGDTVDVEAGAIVSQPIPPAGRVVPGQLPGGDAAVTLHVGPYEGVAAAYEAVQAWLTEHKRVAAGDPWELYLTPPEANPPQTEVVFPLAPA